jgi:uncharacterized membrane protein
MTPLSLSHLPPGTPFLVYAAVIAALVLHIGGGSVAILSGYAAVSVTKGERLHRLFGTVFVLAMVVMAVVGTVLSFQIQQRGNIAGGFLAFYLAVTGWMAVRRKEGSVGVFEKGAFVLALSAAIVLYLWGRQASMSAKGEFDGYPATLYYVFGSFAALAAALDLKVIVQGGLFGIQRISRHLWRMCFALFFAAASFFLGQQKVMPAFLHGAPILYVPALAPLVLMAFWLLRVRFAKWFGKRAIAA